jgi:hypothetical protein
LIVTKRQLLAEAYSLRLLLRAIISASCTTSPPLIEFMDGFCDDVFRHFALLCCAGVRVLPTRLGQLDPHVYLDAVVEIITSEPLNYAVAANRCIDNLVATAVAACDGDLERASELPVFVGLAIRLAHSCYRPAWPKRHGGAMGIGRLVRFFFCVNFFVVVFDVFCFVIDRLRNCRLRLHEEMLCL